MKTYQLEIEDKYFPLLKKVLAQFPKGSIILSQNDGYKITIEESSELPQEQKDAINEGIDSLQEEDTFSINDILQEAKTKYPDLNFDYE